MTLDELESKIRQFKIELAKTTEIESVEGAIKESAAEGNRRVTAIIASVHVTLHPDAAIVALETARCIAYENLTNLAKEIGVCLNVPKL